MANTNHLTPLGGYSDAGAQMLRKMSENATLLTDFLRFQGRVFKHPASIALEFFTQKPDAAFIATAAQWEKAGFTLTPGSEAIRFFDEHGKTIEMFDFSQCEEEAPPMIWAVTNQNLAAVKEESRWTILDHTQNEAYRFRERKLTFTNKVPFRINYEIGSIFLHIADKHIKLVFDDITVFLHRKRLQSDVYI